jgi:hypothetical protein
MFVSGVFVAAGGRGPQFDRGEEAFGGTIFALGGLLCLYGAYVMRGRRESSRAPRLRGVRLAVTPDDARRGDEISVTLAAAGGRRSLDVGLVCFERFDQQVRVYQRGASTVLRQIAESTVYELWQRAEGGSLTFAIPDDAPYSWEGECVSYAWRVSARSVRRYRKDRRRDQPIWVRW